MVPGLAFPVEQPSFANATVTPNYQNWQKSIQDSVGETARKQHLHELRRQES